MTLDQFLRARIAEDEGKVRRTRFAAADRPWTPFAPRAESSIKSEDLHISGRRVLADAAAKRQVVEYAGEHPMPCDGSDFERAQALTLTVVLHYLAAPYADHPDFRPEWAP